ncbi:MAG TPA: methyltransferase domain-containing protein [Candidatus Dormibacteraeota bacterium]|nr:methyltransferase domain-containing protein [Candidatus Dormibacteraeota bacterium]
MDYELAVESAPPGWRHFTFSDLDRLPAWVRDHELARVPDAERVLLVAGDHEVRERALRAFFWTFVYHLEPERWDELARAEPIHPGLLKALPTALGRVLEIAAGSGRLTAHLAPRCTSLVAVEPSAGLRRLLRQRLADVHVVAAWAEALPIQDGQSQLTAACGSLGPDPSVLVELERVTGRGGEIVLISPEQPEWFEANGWQRLSFDPVPAPPHEDWIDAFFGPLDPPHELVSKTIT